MYSLEGEWDRYKLMYGGSVGYGGAQAGTGTGGVDGVGVTTIFKDGSVSSENGTVVEQTLPDGTKVQTAVIDGRRFQLLTYTDGSTKSTEEWGSHVDENGTFRVGGVRVETTSADKKTSTLHIACEDGSEHYSVTRENGTMEIQEKLPNGTLVVSRINENGFLTSTTKYPDGTYVEEFKNGAETDVFAKHPDGSTQEIHIEGGILSSRETLADGTIIDEESTMVRSDTVIAKQYKLFQFTNGTNYVEEVCIQKEASIYDTKDYTITKEFRAYVGGQLVTKEINTHVRWIENASENFPSSDPIDFDHYIEYVRDLRPVIEDIAETGTPTSDGTQSGSVSQHSGTLTLGEGSEIYSLSAHLGTSVADEIHGSGLLYGAAGKDTLVGGASRDILDGGSDNDILEGGAGGDRLDGGDGFDFASYENATAGILASLANPSRNLTEAAGDLYLSIEGLGGSAYNDRLIGDSKSNILVGGVGNDTLEGGGDGDGLTGGDGFDYASYENASAGITVNLTNWLQNTGEAKGDAYSSIEGIVGSAFNDALTGNASDNRLQGGEGSDTLAGGEGYDTLDGGSGVDWVSYATARYGVRVDLTAGKGYAKDPGGAFLDADGDTYINIENVEGGNGVDILVGDAGANWLKGMGSDDILQGRAGADTLDGGAGFNWASYSEATTGVTASLKAGILNTGEAAGDVYIDIQGLQGSGYSDKLIGRDGGTALSGLGGHDTLVGGNGADNLDGGDGNDVLDGGAGADKLVGGAGVDWASYATSASGVTVSLAGKAGYAGLQGGTEAQGDTLDGIENLEGSQWVDVLEGDAGANWLKGMGSDDILRGGLGADTLEGGTGFNWASYSGAQFVGVTANLKNSSQNTGEAYGDVYIDIHGLQGSNQSDNLTGRDGGTALSGLGGNDTLTGGTGADNLDGGDGNDYLYGGAGADNLTGGAGRDIFVFNTGLGNGNVDRIADFNTTDDAIYLSSGMFAGVSTYSLLYSGAFKVGAYATSASTRVIYNNSTGELFYDADGTGASAQIKFAELSKGLALTSLNFVMI